MSKARNMARMGQDTSAGYTGAFDMPAGTTAERPASAGLGWTRLNTETGSVEVYDGTNWNAVTRPFIASVTGTIYAGAATNLVIAGQNFTGTITVRFIEGGSTIADVTGVAVSNGSATVAVPAAVYGQTAGDSIEIKIVNSDGTLSANSILKTVIGLPTGGTLTTSGGYRYHTFTSSSNLVVPTGFSATADYLVVAGGGGGGAGHAGGGGAGGTLNGSTSITAQTYSVTVGAGGTGVAYAGSGGTNGANSTALAFTAIGGGYGGSQDNALGRDGASGGSGGGGANAVAGTGNGGSGTSGQGNSGGTGSGGASWAGGGGGGSQAAGQNNPSVLVGGAGGAGLNWQSLGNYYGGGGGGGGGDGGSAAGGAGGVGGGGSGKIGAAGPGTAGTANTGGGGGGARDASGGNGGSGIVIVRYAI